MSPIDALRSTGSLGALSGLSGANAPGAAAGAKAAGGASFADLVKTALEQTSRLQDESAKLQQRFQMEDPTVGLEETVIAMQKANLGFQAVVQARNKLVAAYTEIMNMNV